MRPISSRQATGVLLVVLSGWSLTMTAQDGRDGWIVLLLAGLCSLPVAALCCLASERMPQGDWFQLPRAAFGTVGGALYMWTLAALAFWSLCMTVLSGVIFLRTVSGGIWPVWLLTAALLVCAAASAQHGVRQLALWAQPMVWLVVLALLLSLVLSWKQLDFYELRPILSGGVKDLPKRVYLLLSVPFGEVFYAAAVLGGQGTRIRNGLLRACVLAGVLLSVLYLRNICLLGAEGARGVLYPSYTAASVLSFGEAFQRGEVLISGSLLVCTVARAALILSFFAGCVQAGSACQKSHGVWLGAILGGLPCILCAGSNQAFGMAQELYQILFLPVVVLAAGGLFAKVHTKSGS